eukprot:s5448_g6.t1
MDVDRVKGKDKGKGYNNKSYNSKGDKGKSNGKYGKGYGFQQSQGKKWMVFVQGRMAQQWRLVKQWQRQGLQQQVQRQQG